MAISAPKSTADIQHSNSRLEKKRRFIRQLAVYLADEPARKSIELQMGKLSAQEWANLRQTTPLMGYTTVDEAEQLLTEFLG